jgi:hypothetical protein
MLLQRICATVFILHSVKCNNIMDKNEFPDLARDLQELLLIAHRVPDDTDRRAIADIAEKWLRKVSMETK